MAELICCGPGRAMKQEGKISFSQQEFPRKDAKVAKTQSPGPICSLRLSHLCVFA